MSSDSENVSEATATGRQSLWDRRIRRHYGTWARWMI
jgi:hypothetical protein